LNGCGSGLAAEAAVAAAAATSNSDDDDRRISEFLLFLENDGPLFFGCSGGKPLKQTL